MSRTKKSSAVSNTPTDPGVEQEESIKCFVLYPENYENKHKYKNV